MTVSNGGYGSLLAPHPNAAGYFYLMTDRGPNVNAPKENGKNGLLIFGKTLEQCTDEDLSNAGIIPVRKSLIIELLDQPVNYPHDKPEGFTLLNNNKILAVVNDDDFGIRGNGIGGIVPKEF